uniref:Nucleotidyltransferase domain-containing protein n=1 Tax=Candidatus Kentrum sp. UNK TaxID=2126344 RepID=A0A451ARR4_9GAMM|nr:MAG: Nucleotidyltransferase domain-containing protein [Candidatus Kentron sp. UNK]VFK68687.1 MAG: Nucleotidyltransferase domain-containing protein [Candidatus Kentron sp. UNK]
MIRGNGLIAQKTEKRPMKKANPQNREETNLPAANKIDPDTVRAAAMFLTRIRQEYPIDDALLFGSRARGDFRPDSDADIAVFLRGQPERLLPIKLAMADVAFDVSLEAKVLIDPLPIWEAQWRHTDSYSNPWLLKNIAREGVLL